MKGSKMFNGINALGNFRYSVTGTSNGITVRNFVHPSLVTFNVSMSTTYEQLITAHLERLQKSTKPGAYCQVSKNHMTAIRAFMRHQKKTETSSVGPEFGDSYDENVKTFLSGCDLSERTRADRRSLLNAWRATFVEHKMDIEPLSRVKAQRITSETGQTPFETALREAIRKAGTTAKAVARKAGVSHSATHRWINGAIPNSRGISNLSKLDSALNLKAGTLACALAETTNSLHNQIAFRSRLLQRTSEQYLVKLAELTPEFIDEWHRFFDFKTSAHPGVLERNEGGRWAMTDVKLSSAKPNCINSKGIFVSASANISWGRLASFFGYLRLPIEKGGYGVSPDKCQALAWLADANALDGYMRFLTDRSGGICHGGHKVFATFVISMTRPKTGYLVQCPHLFERLPANATNGLTTDAMCQYAHKMATAWKARGTGKSRSPIDPIRNLVELDEPLAPIIQAMARLRQVGNAAMSGTSTELLARRDELILGMLLACPLRAKNHETLTYHTNNTGSIYRTASGRWRIRIALENLKNGDSKREMGIYDIPVAEWLHTRLDDYVRDTRTRLIGDTDPGYFFLTDDGKRLRSFSALVTKLTRQYIPGCVGFGPHAFRHIVATDWLKKNPNDFLTVSELLGDTIETVTREYTHLKQDVAFSRYESYVSALLKS